jgi:hypothetical protein
LELVQSGGVDVEGRSFASFIQAGARQNALALLGRLEPKFTGEALAYRNSGGSLTFVADDTEVLPGQTQPASGYTSPRPFGDGIVFRALTGLTRGLYRWSAGQLSVLVDDQIPVPGQVGVFGSVGRIAALQSGIAFGGSFSGGIGVFIVRADGSIDPLVLPGQVTNGGETILEAHTPSGSDSLIAFRGTTLETSPAESVFVRTGEGQLIRILGAQEVIEGETVLLVDGEANHNVVSIRVLTASQRGVIYRAVFPSTLEVPSLSSFGTGLLLLAVIAAAWRTLRMGVFV